MKNNFGTIDQSDQSDSSDKSDKSDKSDSSDTATPILIPKHGGYRKLRSFQTALAVYDGTVVFCERFIDKRSRTNDQMVQAARSGVRNIEEGSAASGTSKKTEIKLTNVARASLEELLRDYEDFLRHRQLPIWEKNSPQAMAVRLSYQSDRADRADRSDQSDKSDKSDRSDSSDPFNLRTTTAEVAANTMLCLINQASFLLHRQLQRLEQDFLQHGGFTERLYSARTEVRRQQQTVQSDRSDKSDQSDKSDKSDRSDSSKPTPPPPTCPQCGSPMRLRAARQGNNAGSQFWGCSTYPNCKATRSF